MTTKIPIEIGHICMNHFLMIDLRDITSPSDEQLADIAEKVCSTSFADDLLVLEDSSQADVRLRIFGRDRREAEFCGNGMIYTAEKIGSELQRDQIIIESASGIKQASRQGDQWKVEVGNAVHLQQDLDRVNNKLIDDKPVYGLMRAGEPHLVLHRPNIFPGFHINTKDFESYCRPLRDITTIDGGINVTVIFQIEFRSILIRTYERGVQRQTFSCGTGSVAAIAAVFEQPTNGTAFHVCSPGGMHEVIYENDCWYLQATPHRTSTGYLQDSNMHFPFDGFIRYQ